MFQRMSALSTDESPLQPTIIYTEQVFDLNPDPIISFTCDEASAEQLLEMEIDQDLGLAVVTLQTQNLVDEEQY